MALFKTIQTDEGNKALSVFFETTGELKTVEDDNENFDKILEVLEGNSAGVGEYADNEYAEGKLEVLFNAFAHLADTLTGLTDRVTYSDYMVYFDNEPVDSEIADIIIRSVKAGDGKVGALVNFLEKLYSQATPTARRNLFRWISDRNITLHPSGDFIAYKGLQKFESDGETKFRSVFSGQAYVNNTLQKGQIVQGAGDTVTMPPSMVEENESVACSTGLHAGTYSYASGWHRGGFFTVLINPANVVSVPKDSNGEKIRVSRYTILEATEKEYTEPVWEDEDYYDDEEFEDSDEYWGDEASDSDWLNDEEVERETALHSAFDAARFSLELAEEGQNGDEDDSVLIFRSAGDGRVRVLLVDSVEGEVVFGESLTDSQYEGDLPAPFRNFRFNHMNDAEVTTLADAYDEGLISSAVFNFYTNSTGQEDRQKSWDNHPSNGGRVASVFGDTSETFGSDDYDDDDYDYDDEGPDASEEEQEELFESVSSLIRKFGDDTANVVKRIAGAEAAGLDFQGWGEKLEKKGDDLTDRLSGFYDELRNRREGWDDDDDYGSGRW